MSKHPEPTKNAINQLIHETAGQGNVITVNRFFVKLTGSLEAALLLAQLIYWSDRTSDPDGWIAKSYKDWNDEIALSEYQVRNATKTLADFGVETKLKKWNGSPTVHYRLKSDDLSDSILKFLSIDTEEFQKPPTKITTETTTEEKDSTPPVGDVVSPADGKAASVELDSTVEKAKKVRPPNVLFDTIAEYSFNIHDTSQVQGEGGRIGKILRWLKANASDCTPDMLKTFYQWYDRTVKTDRPRDEGKFAERWLEWKQNLIPTRPRPLEPNELPVPDPVYPG